jgi:hypothetical protein
MLSRDLGLRKKTPLDANVGKMRQGLERLFEQRAVANDGELQPIRANFLRDS